MGKGVVPVPGDPVRVPPSRRTRGGLATVESVDGNFLEVAEVPGWGYHWDYLRPIQGKLRRRFGDRVAAPLRPGEEPEPLEPPPAPRLL